MKTPDRTSYSGEIVAVKARIRLIRSFDEISHQYQGYTLVINSGEDQIRVAVGPAAHEKNQFRIGDVISGYGQAVADPKTEWADYYKVSGLKLLKRGLQDHAGPPNPEGGLAPSLEEYRAQGHRRLDPKSYSNSCAKCPWGLTMATQIILDHWNPSKQKWRLETHCYGPRDCPRYKAGAPRKVPGRKPGMIWVDNDVERGEEDW